MMEKKESPRHDIKLDRLSEREKVDNRITCMQVPILVPAHIFSGMTLLGT